MNKEGDWIVGIYRDGVIMEKIVLGYQEYLQNEERSPATVGKYLRDTGAFAAYLGENRRVNREGVREYKNYLQEHYKTASANSMLTVVSGLFMFAGWEGWKVKLFRVQRARYSKPEREMTEKDYKRLILATRKKGDVKMGMLIQTIGSTGVRISELKFIMVESLQDRQAEIYDKGKSRVVLLPVELAGVLRKYCWKAGIVSGSIFATERGNPMGRSNVSKKMKQSGREAGVDTTKIFPHNFRHLFVRIFYNIEKDMARLMDPLGHSNINTAQIYTMIMEEQPRRQTSRTRMVLG